VWIYLRFLRLWKYSLFSGVWRYIVVYVFRIILKHLPFRLPWKVGASKLRQPPARRNSVMSEKNIMHSVKLAFYVLILVFFCRIRIQFDSFCICLAFILMPVVGRSHDKRQWYFQKSNTVFIFVSDEIYEKFLLCLWTATLPAELYGLSDLCAGGRGGSVDNIAGFTTRIPRCGCLNASLAEDSRAVTSFTSCKVLVFVVEY
jgi:hypothetical protein